MEKRIKDLYCGFTDDTINILGKIIVKTQFNGWICEETSFFITGGHERNILGNDNLPELGIEVKQKKYPEPICMVNQPPFESKCINQHSSNEKVFSEFKELFKELENEQIVNFSIVGGETTGTYQFLTGFYGLGEMPNEFQRVMDSLLKSIPFLNCYIEDILVASKGSLEEHKAIVFNIVTILDKNNMAVKWGNVHFSNLRQNG